MPSVCIICHEEKSGAAVADTHLIRIVRDVKARLPITHIVLGEPTGNVLVVCENCLPLHSQKRKNFERKWLMHLLLAGLLAVIAILSFILSGAFNLLGIFMMLLLAGLVAALALLDYMPPLARTPEEMLPMGKGIPQPPAFTAAAGAAAKSKPSSKAGAPSAPKHAPAASKSKSTAPPKNKSNRRR